MGDFTAHVGDTFRTHKPVACDLCGATTGAFKLRTIHLAGPTSETVTVWECLRHGAKVGAKAEQGRGRS